MSRVVTISPTYRVGKLKINRWVTLWTQVLILQEELIFPPFKLVQLKHTFAGDTVADVQQSLDVFVRQ